MTPLPLNIYCAKCHRPVRLLRAQHLPHQNAVIVLYDCHGLQESSAMPMPDIQSGTTLVVFSEARRVQTDKL